MIIIIIDINHSYNTLFFVNNLYCMYGMNCRHHQITCKQNHTTFYITSFTQHTWCKLNI